ncbi:MAG: hypothetical protein AABY15_01645 [Nanoarchaeota archaeon]
MLVAVKTRTLTKVAFLNSKSEKIIANIPARQWIIIEPVTDVSKIANYDAIIRDGGEVYSSQWKTTPPFGTTKIKMLKSNGSGGVSGVIDAEFADVKSVSQDAVSEDSNQSDPVVRSSKTDVLEGYFGDKLELLSNGIASLKTKLQDGEITQDRYNSLVVALRNSFFVDVRDKVNTYISDVFTMDIRVLK